MPGIAERERKARDLRSQVAELEPGLGGEVVFEHIRTRRGLVTIYSMNDGEAIPIPEYMVGAALTKMVDGEYMFTDDPAEAPEYRRGTIKCFMHADSSERESGILAEIGLAGKVCSAGSLASVHAKRMHGHHKHKQEYAAWQELVAEKKEAKQEKRQADQLDATLTIAGKAANSQGSEWLDTMKSPVGEQVVKQVAKQAVKKGIAKPKGECDICGKTGFKNVSAHKRGAHK